MKKFNQSFVIVDDGEREYISKICKNRMDAEKHQNYLMTQIRDCPEIKVSIKDIK